MALCSHSGYEIESTYKIVDRRRADSVNKLDEQLDDKDDDQ